jgi:hypothetical protein
MQVRSPSLTLLASSSIGQIQSKKYVSYSSGPPLEYILPQNFDGTKVWESLLSPVRDQGTCGSCWAFAASSTLADRFAISTLGQIKIELSPAFMVLCSFGSRKSEKRVHDLKHLEDINRQFLQEHQQQCYGATLFDGWNFLYTYGTPSDKCIPYSKGILNYKNWSATDDPKFCVDVVGVNYDTCLDGSPMKFFRSDFGFIVPGTKEQGGSEIIIRNEIYRWGPVSSGFEIYSDFYNWNGKDPEVYIWNGKDPLAGGHAIEIVGWGNTKSSIPYWIVRNSWGVKWGNNGFFKILRGQNHCKIEENVVSAAPYFGQNIEPLGNLESILTNDDIDLKVDFPLHKSGFPLKLVESGKIKKSDLKPLVDILKLPNFNIFISGLWKDYYDDIFFEEKKDTLYSIFKILILVTVLIIVFRILVNLFKKKIGNSNRN